MAPWKGVKLRRTGVAPAAEAPRWWAKCGVFGNLGASQPTLYSRGGSSPSKWGSYPLSAKTFQALCAPRNLIWNSLPSHSHYIPQAMDHFYHSPVDQWVGLGQLGVTLAGLPKCLELPELLPFVSKKGLLESRFATSAASPSFALRWFCTG